MKKTITLLAILMTTFMSFGQDSYGVRTGVNISQLNFDSDTSILDTDSDNRYGAFVGGFVNWKLSEKLSLLTEIQYSAEGSKDRNLRVNYIQLPLMLRLELVRNLTVGLGAMPSLRTRSFQDSFRNSFENITASGILGIEYMITRKLFLDARFHYGLTNALEGDLSNEIGEANNTAIQIGFGVKI